MKKLRLLLAALFIFIAPFIGAGDGDNRDGGNRSGSWISDLLGDDVSVPPVNNQTYVEECSECHFAYQPELLPVRSWVRMMTDEELEDHFGEFLSYEPPVKNELLNYLTANSAEQSQSEISRKIAMSIRSGDSLLSISKTSYIIRKHEEISDNMITGNKDVNTLGNCSACHTNAEKGGFDDADVEIPNYPDYD